MEFKTKPYKHQLDCFERNKDKEYYAYLMEMGTGKSKVLLDTARYMCEKNWINAILIFANKGSYTNWVESEIPAHWHNPNMDTRIFLWKASMTKKEQKEFKVINDPPFTHMRASNGKDVKEIRFLVMNIEALAYERSFKVAKKFVEMHGALVAVDESTTIKNIKAKRTKAAFKIGKLAKTRRIMTGSVVDNNPLDSFAQFEFLEPACLGFASYYSFQNHYAEMIDMTTKNSPRSFKVVTGYKNMEDLQKRMADNAFIIKKDECLDLPKKIYQKFYVELTDEQKVAYAQLTKHSLMTINDEIVSVKIVLTKLLRLHQLVCGHAKDDEGKVHTIKSNRLPALLDVLDEVSGQIIIWANYREDIFAITKAIKEAYKDVKKSEVLTYFGDTSQEDRDFAKKVFKRGADTKGVRFLVGNPQTGGYGITLTGANTVIYYSNNFDAEKRNQSEDRCHRIGQTGSVTYIDLIAKGTIDEKILEALKKKKSLSDTITTSNWQEFF